MVDFSSEVNFLKPNININYNELKEVNYESLLTLLQEKYHIDVKQIELYNGFSASIYSILKFLKLKHCFIYSPCSLEYKKAASNLGYEVRLINRFENLFLPIKEESVVVFANPSYLDGTYYDLDNLFKYWISKDATIIVDETLLDFCGEDAAIKYLSEYNKIYIIKDFSRYYSNSDLAISSIFSSIDNIEVLRKFEPDYKLSSFEMKYLEESLKDKDFRVIANSVNIKNRVELEKIFHSCKYVDFLFHSSSNSLLIRLKNITSKKFIKVLEDKSIHLPNCMKYDFIDEYYLNLFVSSKSDVEHLKEALYAL